ncbi:hypothetical protein JCGZ_15670 [Jatropha curcas]|uniref:Glycosyltransferase 61 catalytic domain-containing protein n=1 Tax=Jatropha curcas TaxID=180498 RepID=A0A067L244_JATCU|nr:hypothetical protein JCGZ_15670 [Jatropha curcas]
MKKNNFKTAILCFLFFVVFSVLQINLSFLSRTRNVTPSSDNPGTKRLKQKNVFKQNSLPPPHPPPTPPPSSQATQINCDRSHRSYDLCKINGPTVLDPTIATLYLAGPTSSTPNIVEKIRPYPRKWESFIMRRIREVTLTSGPQSPSCEVQHNMPALVFSAGGYTGNVFHDFNDGLIPLFITVNSVFSDDQDFILVISKSRDWWVSLISHGFVTINPKLLPNSKTFTHFHALLDKAYSTDHSEKNHHRGSTFNLPRRKPRLILASRSGNIGRVLLNQNEVKNLAENIGFDVIIFEPNSSTPLRKAYALIKSSHAMIGVHGAALTHSLFLRPGSVFLQVVPLGNEWVAEYCFGNLGRAMGLEYIEYRIGVEESSLIDKYDKNNLLIKDPIASQGKNWSGDVMSIYLKEQNVRLDLIRFREYLSRAYEKAKKFMDKEG